MSLISRVKSIVELKENQTLDSYGNVQDISWGTTFSRYLNGESHINTCCYLESLTDELIASLRSGMNIDILSELLPGFIQGILTYIRTTADKPYSSYVSNRLSISIGRLEQIKKRREDTHSPPTEEECIILEKEKEEEEQKEEQKEEEEEKTLILVPKDPLKEKRDAINIIRTEILELTREREYVIRERNRLQIILNRRLRKNMKVYN